MPLCLPLIEEICNSNYSHPMSSPPSKAAWPAFLLSWPLPGFRSLLYVFRQVPSTCTSLLHPDRSASMRLRDGLALNPKPYKPSYETLNSKPTSHWPEQACHKPATRMEAQRGLRLRFHGLQGYGLRIRNLVLSTRI